MEVGKYKYNLANSSVIQINKKGASINLNLNLTETSNNFNIGAIISGSVKSSNNLPIKNAIVKLMNENLEPLYHVTTNTNGEYLIDNVSISKSYTLLATCENMILDISEPFSLTPHENKIINFTLLENPNALQGILSGQITYKDIPISGAVVFIYNTLNNIDNLVGITYTDSIGIFLCSNLNANKYKVKIVALAYIPYETTVTILNGKITTLNASLSLNTNLPTGIISGIITDDFNNFIANADVTLYSLDKFNNLTPISLTKSNSSGIYLFTNVPIGNYIVKSNQSQLIDTTNTSQQITTIHTSGFLALGTYDIALGTLENGAQINLFNRFAYMLGGTTNGSSTVTFSINEYGMYDIIFQYVSPDKNRQLAIDVNGKNLGLYISDITPSLDITDAKTMCISTLLNKGDNTIKFYGNGIDYAPNLGIVTFNKSSNINSNNLKDTLELFNSNKNIVTTSKEIAIDPDTKFLKNLGGINDNYIDFSFTAPFNGEYYLIFEYICDINNNIIYLSINNKEFKYTLPLNDNQYLTNIQTFTVPIVLNKNENIINFHGNGVAYGPNLGLIKVKFPNITSLVSQGILLNSATIDSNTNFTTNIGGQLNGSSTVSIKVSTAGLYYLYLEYLSGDFDRNIIIYLNGHSTEQTYSFPKTTDWTLSSVKIFTIPLNLKAGLNTIKFQGLDMNYGPNLGSFHVELQSLATAVFTNSIYNVALGILKNGATLDTDLNVVKWIGGPLDGTSSLEISVSETGIYNLSLSYKNGVGPLRIRVNSIDTGTIYNLMENTLGTFNTDIILNKKINTLDFHGDDTEYSPYLGEFTLTFVSPLPNTVPEGNYNIADGTLKNGAKIDILNNLVSYIGGEADGSSTISINVDEYGAYDFKIQYVATDINKPLKVDINGIDSGKTYIFPMTSSWIISKIDFFTIQLILNKGSNEITFHGNGIEYGPNLGIVNINKVSFPIQPFATGNYNANEGVLENGAKLDEGSNFAGWIGGPYDGSSTITVKINSTNTYNVSIQYISSETSSLAIDVNGVTTGTIYKLYPTSGWTLQDAKIFTLSLPLNSGNNTIKFHGNGVNYSPSIGIVTVEDSSNLIYNASLGLLENGAILDNVNTLAGWIGGPSDGSVTLVVNVSNAGYYNVEIQYLSPDSNRPLKIDVNNLNTGEIYYLPQTYGININDTKTFTLPLTLRAGGNIIKFHGNGVDYAPTIGLITIINNANFQVYNAFEGILSSGAKIDDLTKFVTLIGGLKDDSCTININILGAGKYNLVIQYIAPDNNRVLKVDINDINNGEIYNTPQIQNTAINKISTITIPINLNSGKNTIKLHSNGIDYAPSIGTLLITPYNNSSTMTYNTTEGFLENGAVIEPSSSFTSWLGGPDDGSSTVIVTVSQKGIYSLQIKYVSADGNRNIAVDVNNINTGIIYNVPVTQSWNAFDAEIFSFLITLNSGDNKIKFHGNGLDYGPDLGTFTLNLIDNQSAPIVTPTIPSTPTSTLPSGTYNFINGKLEGEAKLNLTGEFICYIGGPQDSSSTLIVNVDKTDKYILNIEYLSGDIERPFTLDINNNPLQIIYLSEKTNSFNNSDALTMNITASLNAGYNTIKLHGDGSDYAPYFRFLKISNK